MFPCGECQYKAPTKVMLKVHHSNLHQDIKYTFNTCGHQIRSKGAQKTPVGSAGGKEVSMQGM